LLSLEIGVLLQPPVRFYDLVGIGSGRKNLRNQRIWIQRDRRDQLLELFRTLRRSHNGW
jgi:hypothetical protein